ncbi:MAG: ATP-grasp domain-containing protein [Clostridia bacterium]|nr:ATP-grasp domain-containing protein [Clostridia bacterium]
MKLWLVYDSFEAERNRRYIDFYFEKCSKKNIDLTLVIVEEGIDFTSLPDAAIVRTMNPELSEKLEGMGVKVYNSSFISRIANDKWNTYCYLKDKNIRLPETFLVTEDFTPPYYPMVLKPAGGKGGKDVEIVNDEDEFLAYKDRVQGRIIAQRVVSDKGKDLRVYVVGNCIIKGMLRVSENDFRSNFCLGGKAVEYDLSEWEKSEIQKVIDQFDIAYAGLDFIFDEGKIIFNEMEDVVGARMLYTYTDIDIVDIYLNFIITHTVLT